MGVAENNKRIAKNTIMLYIRMLVMTLISLYTVRVTLQVLGSEDYGIYNVVCGVIGFLGFITMTLNTSAQRYLAFDLGREDVKGYSKTFSMIFYIFLVASIVVIIFAEALGPWLINNYLVIPVERMDAARWIYQISIASFIVRFLVIPYSSSIIANEEMNIFAYISIFESVIKLCIVFLLKISPIDKLVSYTLLLLLMDVVITFSYIVICLKRIPGCIIVKYWNRSKFADMGSFMGWSTFGSLSAVFATQGMSIIINMFFTPAVITSKAVADKVNSFSYSFVANFITATSPQMTKYYSVGDIPNLVALFYRSTKICFFLMLIISVPIIIVTPELLSLWLSDNMLDDMIIFTRLTLVGTLFSALETPISRALHAAGKVRYYQIVNCVVSFITLPIVYCCFKSGMPAYWSYIISISFLAVSIIYRLVILHKYINYSYLRYLRNVILHLILVVTVCTLFSFVLNRIILPDVVKILVVGLLSILATCAAVYYLGLNKKERAYVIGLIQSKLHSN